jgi:hypothetical protein
VEQWKIVRDRAQAAAGCCSRTKPADTFAVLELPACIRRDLCPACLDELQRSQRAAGAKPPVFWRVRRKDGKREATLDLVMLRHLFDRLGEEAGERPAALRYFVALLLLRKRVLKMAEARDAEAEAADLVVFDPKAPTQPPVALFAPDLGEQNLEALKDELLAAASAIGEAPAAEE